MQMTPLIAVHMTAAIGALLIGPVALWARRGHTRRRPGQHPRMHRAAGYAWVTLMLIAAISAIFIRDFTLPNIAGYTPVHALVPIVFGALFLAFRALRQGHVARHRRAMVLLYISACIVAGGFTLLPNRYLGDLLWHQWLALA